MSDLDAVSAELAAGRRYRLMMMLGCVAHVERLAAEGDEMAGTLAFLMHDAEQRCADARLEASFVLPPA